MLSIYIMNYSWEKKTQMQQFIRGIYIIKKYNAIGLCIKIYKNQYQTNKLIRKLVEELNRHLKAEKILEDGFPPRLHSAA